VRTSKVVVRDRSQGRLTVEQSRKALEAVLLAWQSVGGALGSPTGREGVLKGVLALGPNVSPFH